MPDLDFLGGVAHGPGGVFEQDLLLGRRHQAEQQARLGVIVAVVLPEIPLVGIAPDRQRRLLELRLLLPFAVAVRLIADGAAGVGIDAHLAIPVVTVDRAARRVDRDLVVVDAEAVALGVAVGEQAALQHLVRRKVDAGNDIRRIERRLLDVQEIVGRIAVQLEITDLDQRKIPLEPDLGQVEGVVRHVVGLLLGHDLDEHLPAREVAALDRLIQVALMAFAVLGDDGFRLRIRQVLDSLLANEVEFHPDPLIGGINQAEGVAAESVHVPIGQWNPPVAHGDGHLMQRLGQGRPEIPVGVGAPHIRPGIAFDRVVQVRKLQGIPQEKYRSIVADEIPVAFFGIKFHGETADIPFRVGRAAFAGHGGKPDEHFRLFADFREDFRLGIPGDVMGHGKFAKCAGTFGVHAAFGDDLAVEVGKFFQKPDVLKQHGTPGACRHSVLIVGNRSAGDSGQLFLFLVRHFFTLPYLYFKCDQRSVHGPVCKTTSFCFGAKAIAPAATYYFCSLRKIPAFQSADFFWRVSDATGVRRPPAPACRDGPAASALRRRVRFRRCGRSSARSCGR